MQIFNVLLGRGGRKKEHFLSMQAHAGTFFHKTTDENWKKNTWVNSNKICHTVEHKA